MDLSTSLLRGWHGFDSLTWSSLLSHFDGEYVVQIVLAIAAGGLVGLERELRGRAAGIRTMMLVCLGSTLVMIVSGDIAGPGSQSANPAIMRVDPARIAAGIVTGVGFLGAAVVIRLGDIVRGVTTAASIWYAAALGVVIGHRAYLLAVIATVAGLFVLWLIQYIERVMDTPVYRLVEVEFEQDPSPALDPANCRATQRVATVRKFLEDGNINVMDIKTRMDGPLGTHMAIFHIRAAQKYQSPGIVAGILAIDGVKGAGWQ